MRRFYRGNGSKGKTYGIPRLKRLGPLLRTIKDRQRMNTIFNDAIGDQVVSAGDYDFARSGHTAHSAGLRHTRSAKCCFVYATNCALCRAWVLVRDVVKQALKLAYIRYGPSDSHAFSSTV